VLLHLVDGTAEDVAESYRVVRGELDAYGHGLEDKPEVVALSKADALTPELRKKQAKALKKAAGREPLILSAVSGEGVEQALQMLAREIAAAASADLNEVPAEEDEGWQP
ncbi:MAG: GTPase ObgE, partial [Rhizobiales bacterium]|nr:GTPase ObgE [Hyphomicrobiales bacterium]